MLLSENSQNSKSETKIAGMLFFDTMRYSSAFLKLIFSRVLLFFHRNECFSARDLLLKGLTKRRSQIISLSFA